MSSWKLFAAHFLYPFSWSLCSCVLGTWEFLGIYLLWACKFRWGKRRTCFFQSNYQICTTSPKWFKPNHLSVKGKMAGKSSREIHAESKVIRSAPREPPFCHSFCLASKAGIRMIRYAYVSGLQKGNGENHNTFG